MDLSWPPSPGHSINGSTPKETYLGLHKMMHLQSAQYMADFIKKAGKGAYLYCQDITRAYCQLPLDPADWPLVCFAINSRYYADISLPFSLNWAVASCEDTTWLMVRHLNSQRTTLLNYIDDFWEGSLLQRPRHSRFQQVESRTQMAQPQ